MRGRENVCRVVNDAEQLQQPVVSRFYWNLGCQSGFRAGETQALCGSRSEEQRLGLVALNGSLFVCSGLEEGSSLVQDSSMGIIGFRWRVEETLFDMWQIRKRRPCGSLNSSQQLFRALRSCNCASAGAGGIRLIVFGHNVLATVELVISRMCS